MIYAVLLAVALTSAARAEDVPDAELKIKPVWMAVLDHRGMRISIWNTSAMPVIFSPKLTVSRSAANAPKDTAQQQPSDSVQASIEFVGKDAKYAGALPATISPQAGDEPIKIEPGKNEGALYAMDDDFVAAAKTSGMTTIYRASYHGKLLTEISYNEKGEMIRRYEPDRHIITTCTYDDSGKRNGEKVSLPDDPALRASLAAQEKELLARLKAAGHDLHAQGDVVHDMIIFYTAKSLEYDKAINLEPLITSREEMYNLKLSLAMKCDTYAEMNKKLEELVAEYPDKKAFTQNLERK